MILLLLAALFVGRNVNRSDHDILIVNHDRRRTSSRQADQEADEMVCEKTYFVYRMIDLLDANPSRGN